MNRDQKIQFRDKQIRHKYALLHAMPTIDVPELSGMYLKNFYNSVKRYQLNLPDHIVQPDKKFCGECGYIQIPDHSVDINIISGERPEISSIAKFKCKKCGHHYDETVLCRKQKVADSANISKDIGQVKKKTNNAKLRAKMRKQNSLTSLLSKKDKEKKDVTKSASMLSLDSFMKR